MLDQTPRPAQPRQASSTKKAVLRFPKGHGTWIREVRMTATVTGTDIAIRLFAALMAGALIGFDRSTRGRIAGLRTTILMCLAPPAP